MEYNVQWVIQLDATSPIEAAREALRVQRDPGSMSTVFEVTSPDGEMEIVDLEMEEVDDEG